MSGEVEITRDLLMGAGGWKEMKTARSLHRQGLVSEAAYEDGVLSGVVRDGGKPKKVRMAIRSRTDMENFCPCLRARREGIVCAHAVAVGLEWIDPQATPGEEAAGQAVAAPSAPDPWPEIVEEERAEAVAVECHVVLPVNMEAAWEKGQLMVGVELEAEGERRLLSAVGKAFPLFVGPRDAGLLAAVKALSPTEVAGVMMLGREAFVELLDALAGHPRLGFGKKAAAEVSFSPVRIAVTVDRGRVRACWPEGALVLKGTGAVWLLEDGVFSPVAPGLPDGLRDVLGGGLEIAQAGGAALRVLERWFEVPDEVAADLPVPVAPTVILRLSGSLNHLEAELAFRYAGVERAGGEAAVVRGERWVLTDPDVERQAAEWLQQWGFRGPDRKGAYVLKDKGAILRFHAFGMRRVDPDWEVDTDFRFEHAAKQVVPVEPRFEFRGSGEDWFEMGVGFRAGDSELTAGEVRRILQGGTTHRQMKGGLIGVVDEEEQDELEDILADCDSQQETAGVFRMDRRQVGYLREVVASGRVGATGAVPWDREEGPVELGDLEGILRPYQEDGLRWMVRLARLGMGGVLADDMGLGKTLQTLGALRVLGGPSLVVCPSSLVQNWIAEARKFTPGLKAVAIEGPNRVETLATHPDADLLVTSYALLRQDAAVWKDRSFRTVVLDEAQQIKNPDAQVSKAAFRLRAEHRFALTGTPLENSVRDLWSIMNFALPGYLGTRKAFEERFAKPVTDDPAGPAQRRLALRLKPVVLRRLKREVAADLPEKIEQIIYCDLSRKQQQTYEALLKQSRASIDDAEGGRKRMIALTALLRLRQACCDLRLLDAEKFGGEDASVKLKRIEELVAEAVEGGHRVLVFSQFVQMLQVLVPMLGERGWDFCYLDGSTTNRAGVVRRFQESEVPVFLISLKAGGVGLNLTAADTVIHVDPWWNPAVEAQATDRAHRIGQERVVTSYKLIARGTVEEKILALQERKRATLEATLARSGNGAEGVDLTTEEIFTLFE